MTRSRLAALALLSGLLMAFSFPLGAPLLPFQWEGMPLLGWVALSPLMLACLRASRPRGAAMCGLLAGLVFALLLLAWFYPFFIRWGMHTRPEALGVLVALSAYVSLYTGMFAWILSRIAGRFGPRMALLAAPVCWVAVELARNDLFTGFAWGLLGYSQQPVAAAIQVAQAGGVHAISFTLACASSALALWHHQRRLRGADWILVAAPALALGLGAGALALSPQGGSGEEIPAALIQANVIQADKWEPTEKVRIEADHTRLTRHAAASGARLIIWSESSVPTSLTTDPDFADRLAALAREIQADLLVGSVAYEQTGQRRDLFNSAFLVRADTGAAGRYDKQHLVPFGEYVPLRDSLSFLAPLAAEAGDFLPGTMSASLQARSARLGILICYEAVFPYLGRRRVLEGAELLVNLTNDAWYGDTAMPRQHLAMAAMRAVETGRWMLRCANTGISAVISPRGRITDQAPLGTQRALIAPVRALRGRTIYTRCGDAFAISCAILTALATGWSFRRAHSRGPDVP